MKMRRFKIIFVTSVFLLSAAALLGWGVLHSMSTPKKYVPITSATKTALEGKLGVSLPADCVILTESDGGYDPAEYYEYVLQSKTGFAFGRPMEKSGDLPIDTMVDVLKSREVTHECADPIRTWNMRWMVGTYHINADQLITKNSELLWIRRSRN